MKHSEGKIEGDPSPDIGVESKVARHKESRKG